MKQKKHHLRRWILVTFVILVIFYLVALYSAASMFEGLYPPSEVNDPTHESAPVDSSLM